MTRSRSAFFAPSLGFLLGALGCAGQPQTPTNSADGTLVLHPIARLGPGAGKEISGIVRSRRDPSVFWTLNDSGDDPKVYPIRVDGRVVLSVREPNNPGVLVGQAINVDWEGIALDASGRLILADFGNNTNARRDLAIYFLQEPEPDAARTSIDKKVLFEYPDQVAWPSGRDRFNFDAEAIFTVGDEVFILTKHRSDTMTTLYRLDHREPHERRALTMLGRFDVRGRVTAADASDDGRTLAVLTYDRIWLFDRDTPDTPFFEARSSSRPYVLHDGESDSESICFETDDTLLIADEARGELYRVRLYEIRPGPKGSWFSPGRPTGQTE